MLRIESERRDVLLRAAALRSRRRAASWRGRRAATVRTAAALRLAASAGSRSSR